MDLEQLKNRVRRIMEQRLQLEIADAGGNAGTGDLQLDSMALLELVVGIEEEFGIKLNDEDLEAPERFRDLDSISKFVYEQVSD